MARRNSIVKEEGFAAYGVQQRAASTVTAAAGALVTAAGTGIDRLWRW